MAGPDMTSFWRRARLKIKSLSADGLPLGFSSAGIWSSANRSTEDEEVARRAEAGCDRPLSPVRKMVGLAAKREDVAYQQALMGSVRPAADDGTAGRSCTIWPTSGSGSAADDCPSCRGMVASRPRPTASTHSIATRTSRCISGERDSAPWERGPNPRRRGRQRQLAIGLRP